MNQNEIKRVEAENELIPFLKENGMARLYKEATGALVEMKESMNLFDRHNSEAQTSLMVVKSEYTPGRRLRQVVAELQSREAALIDARSNILKRRAKVNILREKAQNEESLAKKEMLELKANIIEESIGMVERPYKGALYEVMLLKKLHEEIKEELISKYGEISVDVIEKEEARYWVIRIFTQALQDIRQSSRISVGNQSVLTRMGFDPDAVQSMLINWMEEKRKKVPNDISSVHEENFMNQCADAYSGIVQSRITNIDRDI